MCGPLGVSAPPPTAVLAFRLDSGSDADTEEREEEGEGGGSVGANPVDGGSNS